jgi:hypothetical protein
MEKPIYNIETSPDGLYHIFDSVGVQKNTKKMVVYVPDENKADLFHLIFGDVTDDYNLDVFAISNNQDMKMILSSVIQTLYAFFEINPNKKVFFTGSTEARTRLYRATISKLFEKTELFYNICGLLDDDSTEPFNKSTNYKGYFIEKRHEKRT